MAGNHRDDLIWAYLIHLSYNMWGDCDPVEPRPVDYKCQPYLRYDENLGRTVFRRMADVGMNMVVLDLGDGVRYESHPEIAVENAWSPKKLREELAWLRGIGLEPVPKLNFSAMHDIWMGDYSHMVSSRIYYEVVRDLIAEVMDLFDKPRFFHLGMDEETAFHQRNQEYVVVRQHDLWWRDFQFYVDEVEKGGARAWIWSDKIWNHHDEFVKRMPKSVLQSNWYYGKSFSQKLEYVKGYGALEEAGYEQVPCGSNHSCPENFKKTVSFCKKHVDPDRLLGYLMTVWKPTLSDFAQVHMNAVDLVGRAKETHYSRES